MKKIKDYTNEQIQLMYLNYVNTSDTLENYALNTAIDIELARQIVDKGRCINDMNAIKNVILDGGIYVKYNRTTKAGTSYISFYRVIDGNIEDVTLYIAWLYGSVEIGQYKQGKNYVRDEGLKAEFMNMNQGFAILYNIGGAEWSQKYRTL